MLGHRAWNIGLSYEVGLDVLLFACGKWPGSEAQWVPHSETLSNRCTSEVPRKKIFSVVPRQR